MKTRKSAEAPGADQAAVQAVCKLHARSSAVQTILFGSRARGDHECESDVDILIIGRRNPGKNEVETDKRRAAEIVREMLPLAQKADLHHMSLDHYLAQRKLVNSLAYSIHHEGIPTVAPERLGYSNDDNERHINWEDMQGKSRDALGFALSIARVDMDDLFEKLIGYGAQQALENGYKALLAANRLDYPTSGKAGHNLYELMELTRGGLGIPEQEPVPGERYLELTEFSGGDSYSHDQAPLTREDLKKEIPEAVNGLMDLMRDTSGYDPREDPEAQPGVGYIVQLLFRAVTTHGRTPRHNPR